MAIPTFVDTQLVKGLKDLKQKIGLFHRKIETPSKIYV